MRISENASMATLPKIAADTGVIPKGMGKWKGMLTLMEERNSLLPEGVSKSEILQEDI